jgi:hypothetical protein
MPDIITSISAAIATAKKLKEIADKIKDADLRNLLADLSLELADVKVQLADMTDENRRLKDKVRALESTEGEKCPSRRPGWQLESSRPHPLFGEVGVIERIYKCSLCGFSESEQITPGI